MWNAISLVQDLSCVVLYSLCANLLHSLIMWLIVSSISTHNLHLLFCCVLFIFALTTIRRDLVSLLRFSFLCHVQVFSCDILLVCRLKCQYNCFSSHFCFLIIFVLLIFELSVLFLVAEISLPLRLFYVVFLLLYRCILNAGEPSSSFFSWDIQSVYFISGP